MNARQWPTMASSDRTAVRTPPDAAEPMVGNYFVSTYPPFSCWKSDHVDEVQRVLDSPREIDDEVPEPPDDPITQASDLWVLGNHRLLCGDRSKLENIDRLLGGADIHLYNTDPPYNVQVQPRSNNAIASGQSSFTTDAGTITDKLRAKDGPLANDCVSDEEFDEPTRRLCVCCRRRKDGSGQCETGRLPPSGMETSEDGCHRTLPAVGRWPIPKD